MKEQASVFNSFQQLIFFQTSYLTESAEFSKHYAFTYERDSFPEINQF